MQWEPSQMAERWLDGSRTDIGVSDRFADVMEGVVDSARAFFASPGKQKRRHGSADGQFGYRPQGFEYSATPDEPDENETFTYWADRPDLVPEADGVRPLLDRLHELWREFESIATAYLDGVGRELESLVRPSFRTASYIQINRYPVTSPARSLAQSAHEDGHLVTFGWADGPGLELATPGGWRSVDPDPRRLVVMPGSVMTLMSGGRVPPQFHRVRRLDQARLSVLFFANPDVSRPVEPFVVNEFNQGADIAEIVRRGPQAFGGPTVPVLT